MADLIYVAVIIAFFALAALFVVACDRIVGANQAQSAGAVSPETDDGPTGSSAGARSRMRTGAA
jgi:hypothetical protein